MGARWSVRCISGNQPESGASLMRTRTRSHTRIAALLVACGLASLLGSSAAAQSTGPVPPPTASDPVPDAQPSADVAPLRVSFVDGQVSFWRPGADDWAPARSNTPLAPGDTLYAGPGGNLEVQLGPRAFVRATDGAQIGLDNQDANFVQFRVTGGTAALDLRQ